ncbi:MAG: hypothetical protein A3C47_05740 [Omnitrophica bacterium RIFCSPHIGHO2_02_FULL_51_18]|nr:MAG: hypothetical protein A3C47_05740 [Omnitrophica bacterium RIFCSPHIGHO2_02_FULL_51_18]
MPQYRYSAKDKTGKTVSGALECTDEKTLIGLLRQQELVILSVQQDKRKKRSSQKGKFRSKIKLSELVLFSRQLATLIDSGISLVQALDILAEQMDSAAFKGILTAVKKDVSTGSSFHDALARHPRAFSPLFVNMVKAGESSGSLDDIMERLASYLEKTDSLIRKVKSALIYPSVVATMAVVITLVLMIKVVPVFKAMFADLGGELPIPTQLLIAISDFLVHSFPIWVGGSIAAAVMFRRFLNTDKGRFLFDHFKLTMPIFGTIFRKVAISKFSRTLSTLAKSGVPILTALEIVSKTAGNVVIEEAVNKVRASIREGENITGPLTKAKVFPPMVVRMIAVGEQTGELEKMLTKIADFYDDQVDASVAGITSLIEPLVIAFLGVVIGAIVICMFLPIFKLPNIISA